MSKTKKFGLESRDVEEYLPWGGIIRPGVMRQKDNSYFSIIEYKPYEVYDNKLLDTKKWDWRRGWVIWNEHQHVPDNEGKDFLVICWNPFHSTTGKVINTLDRVISMQKETAYFEKKVKDFLKEFSTVTEVKMLEYQALMDVLTFSLNFGEKQVGMPDVPLYIDALLAGSIQLRTTENNVYINNKELFIISINGGMDEAKIYPMLKNISFRHSKRLLCFNKKQAAKQIAKYTKTWFPKRMTIRNMAMDNIISNFNGYYTESLLFLLDEENASDFKNYAISLLQANGIAFITESHNLKSVLWGTIPGLFLANTKPPIQGFSSMTEFLHGKVKKQKENIDILEEATNRKIVTPVDVTEYIMKGEV